MKAKKAQMMRFLRKYFAGALGRAWTTWAAQAEPYRLMRRVAKAISMQAARRAWNAWVELREGGAERVRKLELARKALGRLQTPKLSRAFQRWHGVLLERESIYNQMRRVASR